MPLSDPQRQHRERRLLEERARARAALDRMLGEQTDADAQDRAGDLTSMPFHPADRGTDTMNAELDMSNASRIARELEEIDAALARLYAPPAHRGEPDAEDASNRTRNP